MMNFSFAAGWAFRMQYCHALRALRMDSMEKDEDDSNATKKKSLL